MRIKAAFLTLFACMAVMAIAAGAAQAALHWNVSGSELSTSAEASISGGPWELSASVLGTTVKIDGEVIHCNGNCVLHPNGTITGSFKVTRAIVTSPAHCTVSSVGSEVGTIATRPLVGQVIMDPSNGAGPVFAKFTPATGTTWFEMEFHGEECPLSELAVPVSGSAAGQSPNATGVEKVEQPLTFGSSQQTTGGGSLTLGGGTLTLAGSANVKLLGANLGKAFAPTE